MYLSKRSKRLSVDQMKDIAKTLGCPVSEAGAPAVDGKFYYWIEKDPNPQTDKPVLKKYELRPLLAPKDEAAWDVAD